MSTALSIPDYFVIVNPFSDTVNNLGATLDSTNVLNLVRTAKFERRGISSMVISLLRNLLLHWYLLSSFQIEE